MSEVFQRHLVDWGKQLLGSFPCLIIEGARQVGKSTLADMLVAGQPHTIVSLDDPALRQTIMDDPRLFLNERRQRVLVIDEVQREPDLILYIKMAIDEDRIPGRLIVTGSSDLLRLRSTPDSLAGRAATIHLRGLSQGEIAGSHDDFATKAHQSLLSGAASSAWSRGDYVQAIAAGGYPELHTSIPPSMRSTWITSYIRGLLTRDLADVTRSAAVPHLTSLLRLLAANQSGELVKARLASDLGLGQVTADRYFDALTTLFLLEDLPPWRTNLTKREVGRHKISLSDSALALTLDRLSEKQLEAVPAPLALGGLLEGFVTTELMKQHTWSQEDFQLFHFRDRNGLEVDLVIEYDDGRIFLIEVKATQTYRPEHTAAIRSLADTLGDRFCGGAVLSFVPEPARFGERIWGLPVSCLWT
ncbi:MAG: ATP-binding protein [Propionibacteriaceae bacterium]|jgi:predicted AAA+ superfamily ATPase|nr:ATP-binding protein [Propionibacteriaceae bacterium]